MVICTRINDKHTLHRSITYSDVKGAPKGARFIHEVVNAYGTVSLHLDTTHNMVVSQRRDEGSIVSIRLTLHNMLSTVHLFLVLGSSFQSL